MVNDWWLRPIDGIVYPLVWEEDAMPILERAAPSDHGAVLIELAWQANSGG